MEIGMVGVGNTFEIFLKILIHIAVGHKQKCKRLFILVKIFLCIDS